MNYHVARKGQQIGVLSSTDISLKLSTGELAPDDLAWNEGMADWEPISTISGLSSVSALSSPEEVNPYAAPHAEIYTQRLRGGKSVSLASALERLLAFIIDLAVISLLIAFVAIGEVLASLEGNESMRDITGAIGSFLLLVLMIYNLVRLAAHGQTMGKQVMGIRIASFEDNGNAGFVKAVLVRGFLNGLIGAIPFVGIAYTITDLSFIFREDRRCIHDLLAGTHVVKV